MARDKAIIKRHSHLADKIINLENSYSNLSDSELKEKTTYFKSLISQGADLDDLLIDAYATVREAAFRVLGMKAFKVQLIGAIILHNGDIAEMKTGEGKTLTGIFSTYLNALSGKGVHIVTVNEYLSSRDSEINGQVLQYLDLSVGLVKREMSNEQKREAYNCDVTYITNSEIGFDYLRDNMVMKFEEKVQRGFNYAIIDEADSVLIDEARTPLIISGGKQNRANLYEMADKFAKTLINDIDVEIDLETKQVFPTETGIAKAHKFFNMESLFDIKNTEIYHLIMNALKANFVFKKEIEYTVKDGEIVLIDQFTGRIMEGRSYSDGLQQALQAKESVEIEEETITLATITYQNFYRLYSKLSGMTGTAKTDEEEFLKIYNTRVIVCPTNKPLIRKDNADFCFYSKNAKLKKLVKDIKELNGIGRPILIGTTSVESSEQVSHYLDKEGFSYEMINAKNHLREAEIVQKAGLRGAITVATNMAGRGTDIKISDEIKEIGGLAVLGIERNESRRVDNQLRGRAGRQGDPGSSVFYISMEDELMVRFTTEKLRSMYRKLGDDFIQSKLFSKSLTNAQKKLEGLNFDQRKNVLDYDNILSQHRENIYKQRDEILLLDNLDELLSRFYYTVIYEEILKCNESFKGEMTLEKDKFVNLINNKYLLDEDLKISVNELSALDNSQIAEIIQIKLIKQFSRINSVVNYEALIQIQRRIILQTLDKYWTKHINLSQKLRSGIYLQQYAQNNPLNQYIEESAIIFKQMKVDIAAEVVDTLLNNRFTSTQNVNDIYLSGANKDNVIELRPEDILRELGLTKDEFNRKKVLEAFKKIKDSHKNEPNILRDLVAKEQAMVKLMDELDRKMISDSKNLKKASGIKQEQLDKLISYFGIKPEDFTRDKATKIINEKLKFISNNSNGKEINTANKNAKDLFEIMDILDKTIASSANEKSISIELTDKDVEEMKLKYGITEDKNISIEKLREIHLKNLKGVTDKNTINKINIEFNILANLLIPDLDKQINKISKTQSGESVVMTDKNGNVKKSVKINNDGTISDEDMIDTELVETKIKIG